MPVRLRFSILSILSILILAVAITAPSILAQKVTVKNNDAWCERDHDDWKDGDHYQYCEVREITLSSRDELTIDAAPNGGVSVRAWDKDHILVRAKISTGARKSAVAASELAKMVSVQTDGTIESDGPRTKNDEWYSVSYEVFAPSSTDLDLESQNGGIAINGMGGRSRFRTQNGGVSLAAVSGDVSGRTTNGGISVELEGNSWAGKGLDVETTNGGVSITVPNGYSAKLETGTINGRIHVDFPVMVEGTFDRRLNATLGDGGKTIRAVTTNGSVRVKRG